MERMLAGLSSRAYPVGLEPVGTKVEGSARSTSKSAVSRRFVAATQTALDELLTADLSGLDLVALMIDGVHFGEHLCVVALGISIDGTKHPLGLVEGSTENTAVVTDLLTGLRERGLDTTRPMFVGIDGGKALHAAVVRVFEHPVIQRCQLHKIRNVADKLPDRLASTVTSRMRAAYHAQSAILAQSQLEALAKELEHTHAGECARDRRRAVDGASGCRGRGPINCSRREGGSRRRLQPYRRGRGFRSRARAQRHHRRETRDTPGEHRLHLASPIRGSGQTSAGRTRT